MIFRTISGSRYEIDFEAKKIRRLHGMINPTTRQGLDGEWKPYTDIVPETIEIGKPVFILWDKATTPILPDTDPEDKDIAIPLTYTSLVESIEN